MKQNSIFSYVKRNNNNSEGVDGNEQCSPNVKEAPNPKRTKCNSTAKVRKWDDTHLRYGFFLRNFECSRYIPEMQEQPSHQIFWFLTFVITVYLLKCLIREYLIFLQVISIIKFLLMGVPWQTRKYIRGSMITKSLKSTMGVRRNFSRGGNVDILLIYLRLLMLTIRSATRRGERGSFPLEIFKILFSC